MKKMMSILMFFISSVLLAQNPDGKNVSLHFTPLWLWGSADFQRISSVWYPPTQASDAQSVKSTNYGLVKYPFAFGFHTQIKIPTTSFLTLTLGYSYNQKFEEEDRGFAQSAYYSEYNSVNGMYQSVSATISVYNLFSLYMGD
jgi:hypothetical protein